MKRIARRLQSSSFRTFVIYPLVIVGWELLLNRGRLRIAPWFLLLLAWGYVQFRLVGRYRIRLGGGGPGMDVPPERLVTTGPYAWCRNPMYLGRILFLLGLALSLQSALGGVITVGTMIEFHLRVKRDEQRLGERFGQPYVDYTARVKRWIPGLF